MLPNFGEQSLEMQRAVHGQNSLHPHITTVMSTVDEVYEDQGRR